MVNVDFFIRVKNREGRGCNIGMEWTLCRLVYQPIAMKILAQSSRYKREEIDLLADKKVPNTVSR